MCYAKGTKRDNCPSCGIEFTHERKTGVYCSTKCRVRAYRAKKEKIEVVSMVCEHGAAKGMCKYGC